MLGNSWLTETGGQVTLWPVPYPKQGNFTSADPPVPQEKIKMGLVLDTETTGIDHNQHEIIELTMIKLLYHADTADVLHCHDPFRMLQEPSAPLDPLISKITGYTDTDLKGHAIDWKAADEYMQDVDIIMAHNARFDRGFMDQKSRITPNKYWACTDTQIDWLSHGFTSTKQELLVAWHGYYYGAHQALDDVKALIHLLTLCGQQGPYFQQHYLKELLDTAKKPITMVSAYEAPFDAKDILRSRWYKWEPSKKVWRKVILEENCQAEMDWLKEKVYTGWQSVKSARFQSLKLIDNFKADI